MGKLQLLSGALLSAAVWCNPLPTITLGADIGLTYDGHGALSAGASSRLLIDYEEPYRSQILDYLFKPSFGASLHLLKVEIGGDTQSTDGTEPSHEHFRGDLSCNRGYEFWLLSEAKKRNPSILTYALSWGVPAWVGNGSYFTDDNIAYQTQFLTCVKNTLDFDIDYIGIWNERSWGSPDYVKSLRQSMDDAGFSNTKIILPDGGDCDGPVQAALADPAFNASIHGIGLHYPCKRSCQGAIEIGKVYWASEDYSTVADWAGGGCWGRSLVENYVKLNATSTIAWSLIWSVYANLPYWGNGLMYAWSPWSGNYNVTSPIWTSAHFTQFTQPGWRFLSTAGNGSGLLSGGGAYVTLVPPDNMNDVTLIVETLAGNCLRCEVATPTAQNLTFVFGAGLPGPGTRLHAWFTNQTNWFVQLPDVTIAADGTVNVFMPADSILTLSTIATASHGSFPDPPPDAPFPLPYSDNFNGNYAYDDLPRYFSDQGGSFAVRNGSIHQVAVANPGANAWVGDNDPYTLVGDGNWTDYGVSVTVTFSTQQAGLAVASSAVAASKRASAAAPASVGASASGSAPVLVACDHTSPNQAWSFNNPASQYLSNTADSQQLCLNVDGCQLDVILYQCVTTGGTCCGATCYKNLQWYFDSQNRLVSPLDNQCLDIVGASASVAPCVSTPTQVWSYNTTTKQLVQAATGLCLSTPPPRVYATACIRIGTDNVFQVQPIPGYCVSVDNSGLAQVTAAGTVLASVNISGGNPFDPTAPHKLTISAVGSSISASVDGTSVAANLVNTKYANGMAAIGSGYHFATFDDFSLTPA